LCGEADRLRHADKRRGGIVCISGRAVPIKIVASQNQASGTRCICEYQIGFHADQHHRQLAGERNARLLCADLPSSPMDIRPAPNKPHVAISFGQAATASSVKGTAAASANAPIIAASFRIMSLCKFSFVLLVMAARHPISAKIPAHFQSDRQGPGSG
jgi:hypothetical protein